MAPTGSMHEGIRSVKQAKYLGRMGYGVSVLTPRRGDSSSVPFRGYDNVRFYEGSSFLRFLGSPFSRLFFNLTGRKKYRQLKIDRFLGLENGPGLFLPLILEAIKLHRKKPFDVVITSSPPEAVHFVGIYLKRRFGCRWIADFRDLWSLYPGRYEPVSSMHAWLVKKVEGFMYKRSDELVHVTVPSTESVKKEFPCTKNKIHTITNGYDPDDLRGTNRADFPGTSNSEGIKIGYLGGFEKPGRFPSVEFVTALRKVLDRGCHFVLHIWGTSSFSEELEKKVEGLGLGSVIVLHGHLPHRDAVQQAAACDVLMVYMSDAREEYSLITPQKFYHYLGMDKPILAFVPTEGIVADIVRETNSGYVAAPAVDDMEECLWRFLQCAQKDSLIFPISEEVAEFTLGYLTKRLAILFEDSLISK